MLYTEYAEHCDIITHQIYAIEHTSMMTISVTQTKNKNLFIQHDELAAGWAIGIKDAENTIKATPQNSFVVHYIPLNIATVQRMPHYVIII